MWESLRLLFVLGGGCCSRIPAPSARERLRALFLQQGFHDGAGDAVIPGARLFVDAAGLSGIAAGERGVERTQVAHATRLQQDAAGGIPGPGHARADLPAHGSVAQPQAAPLPDAPPGPE